MRYLFTFCFNDIMAASFNVKEKRVVTWLMEVFFFLQFKFRKKISMNLIKPFNGPLHIEKVMIGSITSNWIGNAGSHRTGKSKMNVDVVHQSILNSSESLPNDVVWKKGFHKKFGRGFFMLELIMKLDVTFFPTQQWILNPT